ncbi:hypothetical protein AAMO2058_001695500 [Amorphochlora amoebiformis]
MSDALAAVAIAAAPVHAERHRKMLEACEVLGDAGVAFALGHSEKMGSKLKAQAVAGALSIEQQMGLITAAMRKQGKGPDRNRDRKRRGGRRDRDRSDDSDSSDDSRDYRRRRRKF